MKAAKVKKRKVIKVTNLSKTFTYYKKDEGLIGSLKSLIFREKLKKEAVKNISFSIKQGEFVGFVGPNGAGKTTTLKLLSGIIYPSSGNIKILGFRPDERKEEFKKNISVVFGQKTELWDSLPAIETFNLIKDIYEIPSDDYKKRLNTFVKLLGIEDLLHIQTRKLSMGQRMKCELLTSLLHNPKVLFLDEPTISLDVVSKKNIKEFFLKYNKIYKTTIILTSHDMEDVQDLCKRIIIINEGEIGFDGSVKNLLSLYNKTKKITLTFNRPINKKYLSSFGEIKKYNKFKCLISVSIENEKQSIKKIIDKLPIKDISISESNLEEIIYNIFSKYKN